MTQYELDTPAELHALNAGLRSLEARVSEVHTRVVNAEGRISSVEADLKAANTIQEHLVSQLATLSDRIEAGHDVLHKHVQDEQAHWAYVIENDRKQGRQSTIAMLGVYVTLAVGVLGVLVALFGKG